MKLAPKVTHCEAETSLNMQTFASELWSPLMWMQNYVCLMP